MTKKICFIIGDLVFCNAIKKGGNLIFKKGGGYYCFKKYTKKQKPPEDLIPTDD